MIRTRFWIILFPCITYYTAHADQFSQFAEAHNVLDYQQLQWANKPYPIALQLFGYVKAEGIFDTRQNFNFRDGQVLYFPLNTMPDVTGQDINARGNFDAYAIQTRLDLGGIGPEIWCMNSGFLIEADFLGRTDITIESFALRLAYLELTSENFSFRAGQDWHPLALPIEAPDTVSFNSGIPIDAYALVPQLRAVYRTHHFELLAAAIGFIGDRPFGPSQAGAKTFRDAIMPDFDIQTKFKWDADNYLAGGVDIYRILPRLVTNKNVKERSLLTCLSADIFGRFQYNNFVMHSKFIYAQDAAIWEMIGGYAVHSVDPTTDLRTYTNLRTIAFYTEFIWQGAIEPGIFIGIAKNLGAKETIIQNIGLESTIFAIGPNIDTVFRISPRIRWYLDSFIIGIEYEYTRAAYGIINNFGEVKDTIPVANNRFLFATYYVF